MWVMARLSLFPWTCNIYRGDLCGPTKYGDNIKLGMTYSSDRGEEFLGFDWLLSLVCGGISKITGPLYNLKRKGISFVWDEKCE